MLNIIKHSTGKISMKNSHEKCTPSIMQNRKKIGIVMRKLIHPDTFFDSRKRYFGTFIFVITEEFVTRLTMPSFVACEKNEKIMLPAKRYTVKCGMSAPKKRVNTMLMISS
jgi:hypothetical protein